MRYVLSTLAFATVIVPGLVHGFWSGRWSLSDEPQASAERVSRMIIEYPGWDSSPNRLSEEIIAQAGLAGYWAHHFVNRNTQKAFSVFLGCGRPGPLSVHGPEICYPGTGYALVGSPVKTKVEFGDGIAPGDFNTAVFTKSSPGGTHSIRIFWAWCVDGVWQTPGSPRFAFGGRSVLHKVYLVQPVSGHDQEAEMEQGRTYLRALIPQVTLSLFPKS